MALGGLKSLDIPVGAPARQVLEVPKIVNKTNHMCPSGGGAFPLPSVGRVPPLPLSDTQTHAKARQTAMKPDLAHGRGFRPDVLTNRPSDCGASAVQSSAVSLIDDCSDCWAGDG